MNNKKGFTLIELLAVIVILAVLALIVTPIVTGIISKAKASADLRSAEGYVKAGEDFYAKTLLDTTKASLLGSNVIDKLELSSNKATGKVVVNTKGSVEMAIVIGNKCYKKSATGTIKDIEVSDDIDNCAPKTIYETVIESYPYLEVGSEGCKTPGDNNYTYMGGCYLKGGRDYKADFIQLSKSWYNLNDEQINSMFDSDNKIIESKLEEVLYPLIAESYEETIDELKSEAEDESILEYDMCLTIDNINNSKPTNNYLWYNGFLWRIMGINSDNTVRMITEEAVTAIPYDNDSSSFSGSYAEDWLNNYFYNHLRTPSVIEDGEWCNRGSDEYITDEAHATRTTCSNKVTDKVGLVSLDEYNLAAGSSSYLVNSQFYWTLTPYSASSAWRVYDDGFAYDNDVSYAYGLRPVINVNSDSTITGGNGTLNGTWNSEHSPYVLSEDVSSSSNLKDKATSGEYVKLADKTYRVVSTDSSGNTKLMLDGYYEETVGTTYKMEYGSDNTFSTTTGIGQKLNTDVLNWMIPSTDTINRNKLVLDYTWYQNNFNYGNDYKVSLNETTPTRSINATVGLIRVGEMLSSQSYSISNKTYYWTMTSHTMASYAWSVDYVGYASNFGVSYTFGLRPVIVVNSSTTITSGNGTPSSPYEI